MYKNSVKSGTTLKPCTSLPGKHNLVKYGKFLQPRYPCSHLHRTCLSLCLFSFQTYFQGGSVCMCMFITKILEWWQIVNCSMDIFLEAWLWIYILLTSWQVVFVSFSFLIIKLSRHLINEQTFAHTVSWLFAATYLACAHLACCTENSSAIIIFFNGRKAPSWSLCSCT